MWERYRDMQSNSSIAQHYSNLGWMQHRTDVSVFELGGGEKGLVYADKCSDNVVTRLPGKRCTVLVL